MTGLLALGLGLPLVRFTGFTVKPKPRYVKVPAPLPLSGHHVERDFILFAGDQGKPFAVSRTCTHLGCRVNYLEDQAVIECPCHQSRFAKNGTLIRGPAKKDLPRYMVKINTTAEGVVKDYVVTL